MSEPPRFLSQREASHTLAALVEFSDDAILAKDLQGIVLSWNRGAERMYGYTADEIVGRPVEMLMPPAQADELPEILRRIRAGECIDHYETVRLTKDGRLLDVSLSVSPIADGEGRIVGASAIARDISIHKRDERQIRRSEALLRSIVDSAVDGIIVIDASGSIRAFNRAAEKLFGYTAAEAVGQNVNLLMPSPHREEHSAYLSRYLSTGEARIIGVGREVKGRRKDGGTFPLHLSVGEMAVDGGRQFIGIVHDLTARVQMEAQLREQAALVRLGEMAAVIAHEVKNPLAAVRGAIQVIGRRLSAGSREASVITEIIARLDSLNQLVKDLLLFARPPQPRLAAVDTTALVASTVALLREDAAYGGLQIEISGGTPPVWADLELLKSVLLNLLLNAAHAMGNRGAIRIGLQSIAGWCHIVVADTGPGIPPEIRERLFTPFVTTKARGTGLGLATVKRLVEAHSGTVHVESPDGGGTTVTVRLPFAADADMKES